jgi:hypothetical protein
MSQRTFSYVAAFRGGQIYEGTVTAIDVAHAYAELVGLMVRPRHTLACVVFPDAKRADGTRVVMAVSETEWLTTRAQRSARMRKEGRRVSA